VKPQVSEIEKW